MAAMKPKKPVAKPKAPAKPTAKPKPTKPAPKPKKTYKDATDRPGFLFGKGTE
jgi:hypothetical protein